jgi:hypothetical protein
MQQFPLSYPHVAGDVYSANIRKADKARVDRLCLERGGIEESQKHTHHCEGICRACATLDADAGT